MTLVKVKMFQKVLNIIKNESIPGGADISHTEFDTKFVGIGEKYQSFDYENKDR